MLKTTKLLILDTSQSGFSLIELLLVILIVGFTTLIIFNLPNSIGLIGKSKFEVLAKDIAVQKLEDVRSTTFDNLSNGTTPIVDSRILSLPQGSGSLIISDCPASICKSGEQIKEVDVEIDWKEAQTNKKINISTLVAKNGLR